MNLEKYETLKSHLEKIDSNNINPEFLILRARYYSVIGDYENAKNDFSQKQLYLATLAQPSLPDEALEPKRIKNILSGFIFGLIVWGVLKLFVAGVREHND